MSRKILAWVLTLVLSVSLLTGYSPIQAQAEGQNADGQLGMVETIYNPNFSIERLANGIKRVIDGEGRELILVPRELEEVPAEYSDSIVIRTPVHNAVFLSTTQVCVFRTMDDPETIACVGGVTAEASAWYDIPAIQEAMEKGEIAYVGSANSADYELIQSLEPDVVFVYTGTSPQTEQITKLEELGINYAVDNEYMETDYRARMEWIRFEMTFFNGDDSVDEIMLQAQKNIDDAKAKIDGLEKPTVAYFTVSKGMVYPKLENNWAGTMMADMGAVNAFSGLTESPVTPEAAFEYIHNADIILYGSSAKNLGGDTMDGLIDKFPMIVECKAYENDRVYELTDNFWHSIDQSDIVAADMASMFYPDVFEGYEMSYYVHVSK